MSHNITYVILSAPYNFQYYLRSNGQFAVNLALFTLTTYRLPLKHHPLRSSTLNKPSTTTLMHNITSLRPPTLCKLKACYIYLPLYHLLLPPNSYSPHQVQVNGGFPALLYPP